MEQAAPIGACGSGGQGHCVCRRRCDGDDHDRYCPFAENRHVKRRLWSVSGCHAKAHFSIALSLARNPMERNFLQRRIDACICQ